MSELSKVLGNAAPPHQIAHGGKTYSFWLLDQPRRVAFEKRLYQTAREAVYADREHMTSEEYVGRLEKVREQYEMGEFAFMGERAMRLLKTPKGAMLLLEVLTGESESDLMNLLVARPEEVNAVVATVMAESLPAKRDKA